MMSINPYLVQQSLKLLQSSVKVYKLLCTCSVKIHMLSTWANLTLSDFINYTCDVISQCVLLSTTYTNCETSNMPNLYACCPPTGTHLVKPKCTNILHKMLILNVSKFKLYMVTVNTQYVSHQCFLVQKFISALCLQDIYVNYTRD